MATKPGDVAKSIARRRMGPMGKVVSNPKLRLTDVLTALDKEHTARVKLEKEVTSLRRRLNNLIYALSR